ncbi:MAG: tetratricopeptide repeat protein [Gemmatimonadaceae bacterium]|nr:tetratricopeptide repeat protein [Gemmatimonadaceae bacterium]
MSTAPRIDELRKKFEENPRRYFAPLANELRKAGDLSQAIALCREHLPKQPGHMSGHIVFGQALFENGDLEEARTVFEQALALDPENLIALRHLGDIARRQGDAPSARRWYERVLEADPRNDDIAAQLATLSAYATPAPTAAPVAVTPPTSAAPVSQMVTPVDLASIEVPDFAAPIPAADTEALAVEAVATEPAPAAPTTAAVTPLGTVAQDLLALSPLQAASELPPLPEEERVFLDLEAIEAAASEVEAIAQAEEQAKNDPFFGRLADAPTDEVIAAAEAEAEAAFEEGFVAAEWPDTTDLAVRAATPRSATPVAVDVPAEVVEAFGREATDAVAAELPAPEVELALPDEEDLPFTNAPEAVVAEAVETAVIAEEASPIDVAEEEPVAAVEAEADDEPVAEVTVQDLGIQVGTSILDFEDPETFAVQETPAEAELAPVVMQEPESEPESATEPVQELPWLAEPVTPTDDVEEIVEAFAEDARAKGEPDDVAVVAMPMALVAQVDDKHEASFADVLDEPIAAEADAESAPAMANTADIASGAFVTETMGELLVSQGFLDRAIAVYEELVRRRPSDPVPLGRLAELRAEQARVAAASMPAAPEPTPEPVSEATPEPVAAVRTAQAWFAALAARRVERRTPTSTAAVPTPRNATPIASAPAVHEPAILPPSVPTPVRVTPVGAIPAEDSLASLFGGDSAGGDDTAAQQFATAFSGAAVEGARENLFASGAMAAVREPTPVAPVMAQPESLAPAGAGFSFDRFFPDPATTQTVSPSTASAAPTPAAPGTPTSSPAAESKAADDLAQFSAWLKGLGNP